MDQVNLRLTKGLPSSDHDPLILSVDGTPGKQGLHLDQVRGTTRSPRRRSAAIWEFELSDISTATRRMSPDE